MTATGRDGSSANATAAACASSSPPAALNSAAAAAAASDDGIGGKRVLALNCGLQQTSSREHSAATRDMGEVDWSEDASKDEEASSAC